MGLINTAFHDCACELLVEVVKLEQFWLHSFEIIKKRAYGFGG